MRPPLTLLTVSSPPHIHCGRTVRGMTTETLLALVPAVVMAVVHFGVPALRVMALAGSAAVLAEALCSRIMGRDSSVDDFHALLTGLLFAFLLPASAPWWFTALGSALCVIMGKMIFGGLGGSPFSPVALGWAICRLSWPEIMDANTTMLNTDLTAYLNHLKYFGAESVAAFDPLALLSGTQLGGLGAVQVLALLVGGAYLILRRIIRPHIPLAFLAGVYLTALAFSLGDGNAYAPPLFHLLAGNAVLGAFFLAPDHSSSPSGHLPMIFFGLLAGILVVIIRVYGIYPDGVPFAILLANLCTPLLDRIGPKPFGGR